MRKPGGEKCTLSFQTEWAAAFITGRKSRHRLRLRRGPLGEGRCARGHFARSLRRRRKGCRQLKQKGIERSYLPADISNEGAAAAGRQAGSSRVGRARHPREQCRGSRAFDSLKLEPETWDEVDQHQSDRLFVLSRGYRDDAAGRPRFDRQHRIDLGLHKQPAAEPGRLQRQQGGVHMLTKSLAANSPRAASASTPSPRLYRDSDDAGWPG